MVYYNYIYLFKHFSVFSEVFSFPFDLRRFLGTSLIHPSIVLEKFHFLSVVQTHQAFHQPHLGTFYSADDGIYYGCSVSSLIGFWLLHWL